MATEIAILAWDVVPSSRHMLTLKPTNQNITADLTKALSQSILLMLLFLPIKTSTTSGRFTKIGWNYAIKP